ncbi:MAG: nuclear transport factor 2 family protein [Candidatus Nitrosopolaris sp.]|jgi:hypothetical protein
MSLFTKDTHFVVFMDARSEKPSMEFNRREDLAPVFDELNKYEATTHFMGQSTVVLDGDRATGETYCIAHHVSASEGKRTLFIASIRYYDVFAKVEGKWLFAERKLMVDWTEGQRFHLSLLLMFAWLEHITTPNQTSAVIAVTP